MNSEETIVFRVILNSLKNTILKRMILPFGDLVFGQRMMSRLKFLENAQWWEPDRITNWQNNELQKLVQVAYKEVPFYRQLFDSASVRPEEIQSAKELSRIPIVTKDMLRKGYPTLTTRKTGQRTYEAGTSGSTGKNFFVQEDAYTAGWYRASFMLSLEWSGWKIGEPHFQTGMTLKRSLDRRIKDSLLGCHYFSAYSLDDEHLAEMLSEINKHNLKYVWGYPGSLYYLAKYASSQGWNRPLKSVVTWGDMLQSHYRQMIETTFKTRVFDTYGCGEGIQISAQCEQGNYHLHSFDVIVEFLDDAGNPVSAGKPGNIVVTRLHPGPMPLIRYAVGDIGIPSNQGPCACGRGLPTMRSVQGRSADVIITPSGNRLIVHYFTGILEHFKEIDTFQVVQHAPGSVTVRILPKETISESLIREMVNALKSHGASDVAFNIEIVDAIPLSPAGKHRFIINEQDLLK